MFLWLGSMPKVCRFEMGWWGKQNLQLTISKRVGMEASSGCALGDFVSSATHGKWRRGQERFIVLKIVFKH